MKTKTEQQAAIYRAASVDGHPFLSGFRDGFRRWSHLDARETVAALGTAELAGFDAAAAMNESGGEIPRSSDWIAGLAFSGWAPTKLSDLGLDATRARAALRTRKHAAAREGLGKHAASLAAKAETISDEMTHDELRDVAIFYTTPGQEAALEDDSEASEEVRELAERDFIARETARAILHATAPNMRRAVVTSDDVEDARRLIADAHAYAERRVQEIEDTIDELEAAAVATCELFEGATRSKIRADTIARLRAAVEGLRDIRF